MAQDLCNHQPSLSLFFLVIGLDTLSINPLPFSSSSMEIHFFVVWGATKKAITICDGFFLKDYSPQYR